MVMLMCLMDSTAMLWHRSSMIVGGRSVGVDSRWNDGGRLQSRKGSEHGCLGGRKDDERVGGEGLVQSVSGSETAASG